MLVTSKVLLRDDHAIILPAGRSALYCVRAPAGSSLLLVMPSANPRRQGAKLAGRFPPSWLHSGAVHVSADNFDHAPNGPSCSSLPPSLARAPCRLTCPAGIPGIEACSAIEVMAETQQPAERGVRRPACRD